MNPTPHRPALRRVSLSGALVALLTASLFAAPVASATESSEQSPDTITGTHVVLIASPEPDAPHADEAEVHYIETDDGERVELVGDDDVLGTETAGDRITATGVLSDAPNGEADQFEVSEIESDEPRSANSVDVRPAPTGPQKTAVILLKEGEAGIAHTSVDIQRATYFTGDGSVNDHLTEMSWGQLSLVGRDDPEAGDVYDYLVIPEGTACFDTDSAGESAAADAGIDLSTYDYVSFVIDRSAESGCGYGGYASLGGSRNVIVDYGAGDRRGTIIHEFGHNFGLLHARALSCEDSDGSRISLSEDTASCPTMTYGDLFDAMGNSSGKMPFSAVHKTRIGWIPEQNVQVATADGVYDIAPNGLQGDHTQVLEIPRLGGASSLFVDFRQPMGEYGEANVSDYPALMNGVTIRVNWNGTGREFALVDSVPETTSVADAPLQVGQSLYDPESGVTIETVDVNSTRARVRVTYPPTYEQVYLRGTNNDWSLTTPMEPDGHAHSWRADVRFGDGADERFKFDIEGDWSHNYGDSDGDQIAERDGGDIPVTEGPGEYTIVFNSLTGEYSVTRNPSPPVIVTEDEITVTIGDPVTLDASESYDADNTIESFRWGCCTTRYGQWDTFDIREPIATHTFRSLGTYEPLITVVDDRGDRATKNVTVHVVRGEENLPPVADAGDDVTLTAGESHTFVAYGSYDWEGEIVSYEWSGADVTASGRTWTTTFPDSGSFPVTLTVTDDEGASASTTVTVTVEPGDEEHTSTYPQMLLRGTHNGWSADTTMELVADHTWRSTVEFGGGENERFKFDVNGDWATNFGDDDANGVAEADGDDIPVVDGAGTYTITFDDDTLAYTVTKN